jgi:hypothetical protein
MSAAGSGALAWPDSPRAVNRIFAAPPACNQYILILSHLQHPSCQAPPTLTPVLSGWVSVFHT